MAGKRVLVVEDNDKNMKLFRDVLQASGYSTFEATTGEQAVELALLHEPALVLMDVQLPGIDGVEALEKLRQDERTSSIPVLALTAQAMSGDRDRFLVEDRSISVVSDVGALTATRAPSQAPARAAFVDVALPSTAVALMRFTCGEPMKPATNRLTGLS